MSVTINPTLRKIYTHDGAHSPLGPSSAKRWLNCPGSVRATAGLPSSSSEYADEGTAAHGVSEYCRIHDAEASEFLGWKVEVARGDVVRTFECDQEMVDSVQAFVDWCNEVPADLVLVEPLVRYDEYVHQGFGTLDDARLRPRRGVITDFKHGKGVQVFAEHNEQLMTYALAVWLGYNWLFEFDEFVLRVAQPRLDHFDEWTISVAELLQWASEVLRPGGEFVMTKEGSEKFAAGSWCQFCKIKQSCETRARWALSQVVQVPPDEFEDLDEAVERASKAALSFEAAQAEMPSEVIAKCLAVADYVASWCKDIKAAAMRRLQQRIPVGDWKLVQGRSRRTWNLPELEIAAVLKEEGGVDPYEHKLLTPPKAEKKIGKKHPIMTARDDEGNLIYVLKSPGKPKLAPATDKRPAMSVDMLKEFDDLGEEEEEEED